ncbi:porin [Polycladidibacter hongkongensis]|uniref:porin n=1 Tax=Polycladidibacter hongkongensis TaxID=1647556 RepID=UPI00082BE796|nr:porin [Pseudovibrio hongkongensis]
MTTSSKNKVWKIEMNFKALAIAAAAAAAATSAQAADLPAVDAPVDYVQACDAFGAGFFKLPGKDTCIRVGGRVRTQVVSGDLKGDANDYEGYAKGYLRLTSMTDSEIGLIKTYAEVSAAHHIHGISDDATAEDVYIQISSNVGSFLIGKTTSQFDGFTGKAAVGVIGRNFSDTGTLQVSYTAALGNGVSAAVAAESSSYRGGEDHKVDLVGKLKVAQGWGSAQLVGAYHDVYGTDDSGYAVGGTVNLGLGAVGLAGASANFQAQYADKAMDYLGFEAAGEATQKGYALSAGLGFALTETVSFEVDGSYLKVEDSAVAFDTKRSAVDGSVSWKPAAGLLLAVDAGYAETKTDAKTKEAKLGARVQYTF